jgi:hypothetical protein
LSHCFGISFLGSLGSYISSELLWENCCRWVAYALLAGLLLLSPRAFATTYYYTTQNMREKGFHNGSLETN